MKQIITLLVLVLCFTTSSYAINSASHTGDDAVTSITLKKNNTVFAKAKTFVAKTVIKAKQAIDNDELLMLVCAWFIPPLGVYLYEGQEWTNRVTVNLILTLLFFLPGMIHAFYLILGKK
jgi:uncharacterized membrane protein YqaE (UPF0057 family)